ncbi:MAG: integration host factor, actinobacterial type [Actinomycetota bacterium]|nr:integration host factor, actinobacterial type [Actinomycetota bacterium]
MSLPHLSDDERKEALKKATAMRTARAELHDQMKSGQVTLGEVLERSEEPFIARMKVSALIESLPGYGKARSAEVMDTLQISPSRRIQGLGVRQRAALKEYFKDS